ncbi:MAG: flagellar motor switch protein FliG [Planctomycetaceae bacterium]|nr:flagellar motor switch protein FliG [Planctomycetaceae bacterium]MBP61720.1 flagellar motor switch protein FliG [Planctomycetaceae bacterium]
MTSKDSSRRKAAVLLMSLPREVAGQLAGKLGSKQLEAVSLEIANLEHVSNQEQKSTIYEFAKSSSTGAGTTPRGLDLAQRMTEQDLFIDTSSTIDNARQSVKTVPFGFLKQVETQDLLRFLLAEHPQTVALVLSCLSPSSGAEILAGLPLEMQVSIVYRIATMTPVSVEIITEVETGLKSQMAGVLNGSCGSTGGVSRVAEILNLTNRATELALLGHLAEEAPELVSEIRRRTFVFEDIVQLADKDTQLVLKHSDVSQWAIALKGSSDQLKEKIFVNLSKQASKRLAEELAFPGPVRLSEVKSEQRQIGDVIRRLEDAGLLNLQAVSQPEKFVA